MTDDENVTVNGIRQADLAVNDIPATTIPKTTSISDKILDEGKETNTVPIRLTV